MPDDPITLVQTTDDYGAALIDKLRPTQRRRHWWHVEAVTSDHTVDEDSEFLSVTATATGDVEITLPDASTVAGQSLIVYCEAISTGNSVVIRTDTTGDTIGGAATQSLTNPGEFVRLVCNGVDDWILIADNR